MMMVVATMLMMVMTAVARESCCRHTCENVTPDISLTVSIVGEQVCF